MRVALVAASALVALVATAVSARAREAVRPSNACSAQAVDVPSRKADAEKPEALRVGAILGVGFPRPFSAEVLAKIANVVALGAEYSVLPTVALGGVSVRSTAIALDLRFFPF